jgi:hypothetical protein
MQKTATRSMSLTLLKYQLKVDERPETVKLVQERLGNTLGLMNIGNNFLYRPPMAQQLRKRIKKWNYMK